MVGDHFFHSFERRFFTDFVTVFLIFAFHWFFEEADKSIGGLIIGFWISSSPEIEKLGDDR